MTGEQLYHRWCGSETSDRARYFSSMNPADKESWDRLAAELTDTFERARDLILGEFDGVSYEPWVFLDDAIAGAPPGFYACRVCGWARSCGDPPGEDCHS